MPGCAPQAKLPLTYVALNSPTSKCHSPPTTPCGVPLGAYGALLPWPHMQKNFEAHYDRPLRLWDLKFKAEKTKAKTDDTANPAAIGAPKGKGHHEGDSPAGA